jgi:uncharacterized protein
MYTGIVPFDWDPNKAAANVQKHGVHFSEATGVFSDDYAITVHDYETDPNEQRFVTLGMGIKGRILVVVYCYSGENIRIISARTAGRPEREQYEASTMKDSYDFSKGKRGRVLPEPALEPGKVRITIRLDEDLIDYFGAIADQSGGKAGYQTLINSALREYVDGKTPKWEETLRRIIREEMSHHSAA